MRKTVLTILSASLIVVPAVQMAGAAERIRPNLIVVSAGFDFVAGDPVGDLGVAVAEMLDHHEEHDPLKRPAS